CWRASIVKADSCVVTQTGTSPGETRSSGTFATHAAIWSPPVSTCTGSRPAGRRRGGRWWSCREGGPLMRPAISSGRGGQRGYPVRLGFALILICAADVVRGQVPAADRKISSPTLLQGLPQLTTSGDRVFSSWLGGEAPLTGVGYSYSMDSGISWINQAGLPVVPPFNGITQPTSCTLTPDGTVHLTTDNLGIQYFHGNGFNPI